MKNTNPLSLIYGDEAIYVQKFEKTEQYKGTGYIKVNPAIWKRNEEPDFAGEILNKENNHLTTTLNVIKDHTRGHFRPDIAFLLPGHKSIRTAGIALGRFLNADRTVDPQKIYLSKYESVKFLSPVLPGQKLKTEIVFTGSDQNIVYGDAIQTVNDRESMRIKKMCVRQIQNSDEESVLLLDQLIEAAAQTVGLYVLEDLQSDQFLPLFHGTGEAELFKSIRADDNLMIKIAKIRTIKAKTMNIFTADLQIYHISDKEKLIAEIKNLQGLLMPKEEILKRIVLKVV